MTNLEALRKKIDAIDALVMVELNQRFALMKEVKEAKIRLGVGVLDASREQHILEKIEAFEYQKPIKEIYQLIMKLSKDLQRDK